MIEEIFIRNLGVIGEARLPLGPGFTAITGETGAGKTMVVTALGLLLGERSDASAIRSGSAQAVVEGHWLIDDTGAVADRVRDAGGDLDDGELIIGRSLSAEGRGRATVGGRTTPVSVLSEIGEQLVVVHGQSDQIRLRSSTAQREALDRFAGAELAAIIGTYHGVFRRWHTNQSELDVLVAESDRRAREAEDLRIATAEIEAAAPQRGEDDELGERVDRLTNLEDLRLASAQALDLVSGQNSDEVADVLSLLDTAKRQIERVWECEVDHDRYPDMLLPGDDWRGRNVFNPSYFAPHQYRIFAEVTGNPGWLRVIDRGYEIVFASLNAHSKNRENGLVPAWCDAAGTPVEAFPGAMTNYQYDSARLPFRIGQDWAAARDPRAHEYLKRVSAFFARLGADAIVDGYTLAGEPAPDPRAARPNPGSAVFVGAAAVGAMHDERYRAFIEAGYARVQSGTLLARSRYYNHSWTVLSLLMLSGNFLDFPQ